MVAFVPSGSPDLDRVRLARAASTSDWVVVAPPELAEQVGAGLRSVWNSSETWTAARVWPVPRLVRSLETRDALAYLVAELGLTELRFPAYEALSWATGLHIRQGGVLERCRLVVELEPSDEALAEPVSLGGTIRDRLLRDAGRTALRNADAVEGDKETLDRLRHKGWTLGSNRPAPAWASESAPRVSAVIAHRNLGSYVPACLASLRAQTVPVELVLVDDGSDAENLSIVRQEALRDPSLRLICQANAGPGLARNKGVEAASGELVVFVDADNTVHPNFVEKLREALRRDPEAQFVTPAFSRRSADGATTELSIFPVIASAPAQFVVNATGDACAMHRRQAFLAVGGFCGEVELSEDWELWLRYLSAGFTGTVVPEMLFEFCLRPGSRMHRRTRLQWFRNQARMAELHRSLLAAHAHEVGVLTARAVSDELDELRTLVQDVEKRRVAFQAELIASETARAELSKQLTASERLQAEAAAELAATSARADALASEVLALHASVSFRTANRLRKAMPRLHRVTARLARMLLGRGASRSASGDRDAPASLPKG